MKQAWHALAHGCTSGGWAQAWGAAGAEAGSKCGAGSLSLRLRSGEGLGQPSSSWLWQHPVRLPRGRFIHIFHME